MKKARTTKHTKTTSPQPRRLTQPSINGGTAGYETHSDNIAAIILKADYDHDAARKMIESYLEAVGV